MGYAYDKLGRIKKKTDGQGYTLNYAYDCMGRVLSVTSSAGQKKAYTYDVLGNVTSMTDANGNTTTYEYSLRGKLKSVTDALGNRAEYAYDGEDRLIHICQKGRLGEADRETFYGRNPLGQVECMRDAFGNEEHYEYDALGRTILKADRDGYRTAYGYTADGKISHILYGDGTSVEMEYTALRQLALVKDWLGETRIERDVTGDPVNITDHNGKTVSYEWGSMGERKGITYPDGRRALYHYDDQMRLEKMRMEQGGNGYEYREIGYAYDFMGRISEKQLPEGMRTLWHYDDRGQLAELVHEDERGILDRYRYEYGYDALSRLVSVSRDGNALRDYAYDTFGNRSSMADHGRGRNVSYTYDALNRMISAEEGSLDAMAQGDTVHTDYSYDNRGNMIREETEGKLIHGYEYGAMNRLSKAWDDKGQEALYRYNGLGQRTGKTLNGRDEDYLLDLTKPYHNLLGISGEGNEQCFYFDWNVAAMEETGKGTTGSGRRALAGLHYYMQDELGSPLRVSGFGAEAGALSGRSSYLCYGYDEFGNDLGRELEGAGIPDPYDWQGGEQPFGYTGYRYDEISGTYFAQAREYDPSKGNFRAEDVIKGIFTAPIALNHYSYCWNNPEVLVDYDGRFPWLLLGIAVGASLLLGGCGKIDEEDLVPMPSATSNYEFNNSIEIYNSKEYIQRTNCYAYAFDKINNPITGEELGLQRNHSFDNPWGMQPGMFSNGYDIESYYASLGKTDSCKELFIDHIKNDADAMGLVFQEYNEELTGGYIVAIAFKITPEFRDYHFYREDEDGTWSHKFGGDKVRTGVENPQIDAYKRGYKEFLGYFYITEKDECE